MTASTPKHPPETPSFQTPLLPPNPHPHPQYVVVLPPYPNPNPRCSPSNLLLILTSFLLLLAAVFFLYPSDPSLSFSRLHLTNLHFHAVPKISLDVTLKLTLKVRNKDFFSISYDSLTVEIGYRGEELGFVTSKGGKVRPRGASYVNATLQLDGVEILSDVILLLEDLVKGEIAFDTVSQVSGKLGLLFFDVPIKAKISCEVIVNTRNQTITRQSCYPGV